jgi:hypothetical protein
MIAQFYLCIEIISGKSRLFFLLSANAIAEVVGGFALPCTAVVIGALVAAALGAVGKGHLMAALVDFYNFIEGAID